MKKKILIFLICFILIFTNSIYHDNNIKIVKASSLATMLSFFNLGLFSSGVTYYVNNGNNNLQTDLNSYASSKGLTLESFLSPFQNVVVDVAKDAVKFSAAQVYIIKEFVSSLKQNNKVSYVPLSSASFDIIPLNGYPSMLKLAPNTTFTINGDESYRIKVGDFNSNSDFYFCILNYNYPDTNIYRCIIISPGIKFSSSSAYPKLYKQSLNTNNPNDWEEMFNINLYNFNSNTSQLWFELIGINGSMLGSSGWVNYNLNDNIFTNVGWYNASSSVTSHNYANFVNMVELRFQGVSSSVISNEVILPSYSVDDDFIDNIDDSKDLVVTVPEVIDKAIEVAKRNDSSADVITSNDVAIAIDDTVTGVIDNDAEEEEKRVIGPAIDLDRLLDVTQDSAITDTIVEDLVIEDSIDDPIPPEPPIVDIELGSKFPFSVFYDFVAIMNLFDATPAAPAFSLGFEFLGNYYQFNVDLSDFNSVARILRLMELIAFISGLVILTIKYIRGKD